MQDWPGKILGICGNELQVYANARIHVLGVPITLPYMALQASLYGNCCLHLIDNPITLYLKHHMTSWYI